MCFLKYNQLHINNVQSNDNEFYFFKQYSFICVLNRLENSPGIFFKLNAVIYFKTTIAQRILMVEKNMHKILSAAAFLIVIASSGAFAVGQSSAITLVFPSGARSLSMGEVGTALGDYEDVLFYNPAGLGIDNRRWKGGAAAISYEQLLPAFKIPDLWHMNIAGCFQPGMATFGGFGINWNYINFGLNTSTDEQGREIAQFRSYEYVLTGGWGFSFEEIGIKGHYWGVGLKYVLSALAPGYGPGNEGIGSSYAVDVGYIWRFLPFMRLGLTFANMGPNIFYISRDQADPIPFTVNLALAYKDKFNIADLPVLEACAELRADREIVKNYPDRQPDPFYKAIFTGLFNDTSQTVAQKFEEINWHLGCEVSFARIVSLREGLLIDPAGRRFEHHFGFGLSAYDHFQWDFSFIYSPEGYMKGLFPEGSTGARNGQCNFTFTFFRMFNWSKADGKWWLKK
jgi:hypothetical protein